MGCWTYQSIQPINRQIVLCLLHATTSCAQLLSQNHFTIPCGHNIYHLSSKTYILVLGWGCSIKHGQYYEAMLTWAIFIWPSRSQFHTIQLYYFIQNTLERSMFIIGHALRQGTWWLLGRQVHLNGQYIASYGGQLGETGNTTEKCCLSTYHSSCIVHLVGAASFWPQWALTLLLGLSVAQLVVVAHFCPQSESLCFVSLFSWSVCGLVCLGWLVCLQNAHVQQAKIIIF